MPGKKRAAKSRKSSEMFWDNIKGWKSVEVGDEFLTGGEEYGFMGLEELDPSCLGAGPVFF